MQNELKIFNNNEFGEMRNINKDNEPWFVAKDISDILGYSETSKMLRRLDEDEYLRLAVNSRDFSREMKQRKSLDK